MEGMHMEHTNRISQSNSKIAIFLGGAIIFLCFLLGCSSQNLQKKDIMDYRVQYLQENGGEYIVLSGVPGHSALIISKIIISDYPDSVNINANLEFCRDQAGLLLDLKFKISNRVKYVTLGDLHEIIWQRMPVAQQ